MGWAVKGWVRDGYGTSMGRVWDRYGTGMGQLWDGYGTVKGRDGELDNTASGLM